MKKTLIALAAFFLCSIPAFSQTCTPGGGVTCTTNLNLWQPPAAYQNWASVINSNWASIDSAVGNLQSQYQGAWSSAATYSMGQIVSYNGSVYVSIINSNLNNTPSSASSDWTLLPYGYSPGYAPCGSAAVGCPTTTGLNLLLGPGTANCSGPIEIYDGGTLTLTASVTNYVYLNTSASCAPAVKTTAFTSSDIPIATVVAGASTITSISDDRTFFNAPSSGSAATFQHNGANLTNQELLNFNDSTPAAPIGSFNVFWQPDSSGDMGGYIRASSTISAQCFVGGEGLLGAFTDGSGIVKQPLCIGRGPTTFTVPSGATQLQLGIDTGKQSDNTGSFIIDVSVNGGSVTPVTVVGTSKVWDTSANPGLAYGINDGTSPVVAASGLTLGNTVTLTYLSGTVGDGSGDSADANGSAPPTANMPVCFDGTYCATLYMTTGYSSGAITGLSGDGAASGPGIAPFTLANVNSSSGACGDATHVCQITTNAKGLTTNQTAVPITGGSSESPLTIVFSPDMQCYTLWISGDCGATASSVTMATDISTYATSIGANVYISDGDTFEDPNDSTEFANVTTIVNSLKAMGLPWVDAAGNHDYPGTFGSSLTSRTLTNYNSYIGQYMLAQSQFGASYASSAAENSWYNLGSINGKQWGVIALEWCPRNEVLSWASGIVDANPDLNFIVVTHNYLSDTGRYDGIGVEWPTTDTCQALGPALGSDQNEGNGIWSQFIANHDRQIKLVLGGHWGEGNSPVAWYQRHPGSHGFIVNEVYSDYQTYTNGGSGYAKIIKIYNDGSIGLQTYSPYLNSNLTDGYSQYTLQTPIPDSTSAPTNCYDTSGSGTAQSCVTTTVGAPSNNQCINYWTITANTTSSLTLAFNEQSAVPIWVNGSSTLSTAPPTIPANTRTVLCYNSSGPSWNVVGENQSVTSITGTTPAAGPVTFTGSGVTQSGNTFTFSGSTSGDLNLIASGSATLGTTAISSGACSSPVTVTATNAATTDVLAYSPGSDPTGVTGYGGGGLNIWPWTTSGDVNFKVCNPTASSITPSVLTLNWNVLRPGTVCPSVILSGGNVQEYCTGSITWHATTNGSNITVEAIGGGGGGCGGNVSVAGGGGGGGEYAKSSLTYTSGSSITLTIGSGGTGGTSTGVGAAGSASSFGSSVIANGGGGCNNSTTAAAGGTGGTGSLLYNGGSAGTPTSHSGLPGGGGAAGPNGVGGTAGTGNTVASEPAAGGGGGSGGGGSGNGPPGNSTTGGAGGANYTATIAGGTGGTTASPTGGAGSGNTNGASGGGGGSNSSYAGSIASPGGSGGSGQEWTAVFGSGGGGGGGGGASSTHNGGNGGNGGLYGGAGGGGGFGLTGGLGGNGSQGIIVITYTP